MEVVEHKGAIQKEAIQKEAIPKEVIPKEAIQKEVIPKEAIQREAIQNPKLVDDDVLKSQLEAFEGEILDLRADNQLLEQDKQELIDAIEKLKHGVRSSDDTVQTIKTENQTLKLELKGHLTENIAIQKKLESLLASVSTLKQQLEEKKVSEGEAREAAAEAIVAKNTAQGELAIRLKTLQQEHAMKLGKVKREHTEEKEHLLEQQNKKMHESETCFRQSKLELQETLSELKETVTNQATRICSYERRIEQLDTENNRLRIQQQISSRNKLSVTQQQEIESMKQFSREQQEDIDRLKMALELIHMNQHQDFRGLTGT